MRILPLLVSVTLLAACGGSKTTKIEGPPPPTGAAVPLPPAAGSDSSIGVGFKTGPGGFPVPSDADAGQQVGADNTGYKIPRPKDEVYAQLRPKLEEMGFKIETHMPQPDSHRLIMYKDAFKYIASVSSDGAKNCTLFITVSATDK